MENLLNEIEVRVLGSLIEKQLTTPQYYPMTLNALVNACNQTTNREPVVSYDEKTVARGLESLRDKKLVHVVYGSDSRVPKYRQMLTDSMQLSRSHTAAMCVLMLRGPQTVGEIRNRTGRMYEFTGLDNVEATLDDLTEHQPEPLVVRLPRVPGQKEARVAQLLGGPVEIEERSVEPRVEPAMREVRAENERIAYLEIQVIELKRNFEDLCRQFDEFRKQFE